MNLNRVSAVVFRESEPTAHITIMDLWKSIMSTAMDAIKRFLILDSLLNPKQ